jgi:PAS domain S-box-containing protein
LPSDTPTRNRKAGTRHGPGLRRPRRSRGLEHPTFVELEAAASAVEALSVGLFIVEQRPDGRLEMAVSNAAHARIVGKELAPGTPLDELAVDLYEPDRMTRIPVREWPVAIAAGTGSLVHEREVHLRRSDGEWRVLLAAAAPLRRDPADPVRRAAGALRDVTGRRRAEEDLSRRGQLLRLVIETSPDPVFVKNRDAQYLYANPAWLRAVGREAGQVVGLRDRDLLADPATARAIEESDRRIMEKGAAEAVEEELPTAGGPRTLLTTKTPWTDSAGQVIGVVGIARDITKRKRAEEALRQSERRFRALIEKSSDMTILLDAEGLVRFWSPGAVEALGWGEEALLGKPAIDLVHEEDRQAAASSFAKTIAAGGRTVRHRLRLRHREGGYRIVDGVARDLRHDPAIGAVVLNVRDVTDQARTEEMLLQSRKLDGIGRIAGGFAHDVSNLLTSILCGAESELEALDAGRPVSREDVDLILEAVERARDVLQPLLAFARKQAVAPYTVDVGAVVATGEGALRGLLGERVRIEASAVPGLWPVRCDPSRLEQLLVHLAENARDAMPDGGVLTIVTDNVAGGAAHPGVPHGEWVRLRFTDSGSGMSPEVREHVFEPYFTTRRARGRAGLGLASVYGIVREAGGHVRVESAPGAGTTFEVLLPRAVPGERVEVREPAAVRGGTETVLLVEDDPGVREAAARALRKGGYRVLAADGPGAAVTALSAESEPPALLVTDVVMPGANGPELVEELRRDRPGLRVLFLSGHAPDVVASHGGLDPAEAFLAKPFTSATLLAKVRQVLDAG